MQAQRRAMNLFGREVARYEDDEAFDEDERGAQVRLTRSSYLQGCMDGICHSVKRARLSTSPQFKNSLLENGNSALKV
jgi:hypothetical protein